MLVQEATSQTAPRGGTDYRALGSGAETPAAAKERTEKTDAQRSRPQETSVQTPPQTETSSRARLNFDPDKHRVFVEIVDPDTGDVISRFPPEQIANHIDKVLEQTDQETNLEDAGLIFDQKV